MSLPLEGSEEIKEGSSSKATTTSSIGEGPVDAICLACDDARCDFKPQHFQRRPLGPKDVLMDVKFCGVCHSDLHTAADHMAGVGVRTPYPCVPGHEVAGIVAAVGSDVKKFQVGDQIGVGCFVDSCLDCDKCKAGNEHHCRPRKLVVTYGGFDNGSGRAASYPKGSHTKGGYSTKLVINEHFGITIPAAYPLEMAGPVMCAGITMYDPLKLNGAKDGTRVGIIGLGGLGVMGMKVAKAMGCSVTAISRSKAKEELARKAGAENYVASGNSEEMKKAEGSLDLILNTISAEHDWAVYQRLLDKGGCQVMLGIHKGTAAAMVVKKASVRASMIGGLQNTQEVMDLCARAKIYPEIELKSVDKIKEIFEALDGSNETGVRYVLDIQGTLNEQTLDGWKGGAPNLHAANKPAGLFGVIKEALRIKLFY